MRTQFLIVVISLLAAGCGTVNTVVREDVAVNKLKKSNTYCDSLPRVYSGVSYNFCTLHSTSSPLPSWVSVNAFSVVAFDFVLSGVLDTVALPYTLYRQSKDGNISVRYEWRDGENGMY